MQRQSPLAASFLRAAGDKPAQSAMKQDRSHCAIPHLGGHSRSDRASPSTSQISPRFHVIIGY
jgi:hypothetical protein